MFTTGSDSSYDTIDQVYRWLLHFASNHRTTQHQKGKVCWSIMKFTREMLEEELCCSICFDLYDKPVMLPCSHNFCGSCIQNLIHHRQKRVERAESPGSVICTINCPTCRRSVSVDTTRIDLLPTNKTLENIVQLFTDTYGDLKKDDVAPPPLIDIDGTEICAAHFQRKTLYCYPCKSWMCIECLEKHQDTCSKGAATFDSRKETCKEDDSSLTSVSVPGFTFDFVTFTCQWFTSLRL